MGNADLQVLLGDRVARLGESILHERAIDVARAEIEKITPLLEDMAEVRKWARGTGIAAPQVRANKRVIMFGYEPESAEDLGPLCGKPNSAPETILINP